MGMHQVVYVGAMRLFRRRKANILDPVHPELDPTVWDKPDDAKPVLKPEHSEWIRDTIEKVLAKHGYEDADKWLSLVLTGSLTTYQYAEHSDVDVSLFIDSKTLPEWSRAEMIGIMVSEFDNVDMPGTTHVLQAFVVSPRIQREDLYHEGLRSAYDIDKGEWLVPPDHTRSHDVEREMNELYTQALEGADKMERLLRYEPDKAMQYYDQIHRRRMRDQTGGRGDFSSSNILYKMLDNRGYFDKLRELGKNIV
jgi:hypothetical protein